MTQTVDRLISEGLVTLQEAAKAVRVNVSTRTLRDWCSIGVRGIVLESMLVGSRRHTSVAALKRFLAAAS